MYSLWSQALLDAQEWLNAKVLFIAQFQAALFHTMKVIGGELVTCDLNVSLFFM